MKKVIPIVFLSIYLISTTELHQLVKLPLLVEHFMEHKQENKDITLWKYLCIHYAHSNMKDADYEKDMKLPFKSHEDCSNLNFEPFTVTVFSSEIIKPIINETQLFPPRNESFLSSSFQSNIWQPPKFC